MLEADHEEADTRLILNCIHAHMESMVVYVRDTDVLVLLLAHYDKMRCTNLLMKAGTSKQAHVPSPVLLTVTYTGWDHKDGQLVLRLLSVSPIPKACSEIMSCGCTMGCLSRLRIYRKISLQCIEACKCHSHGAECRNVLPDGT